MIEERYDPLMLKRLLPIAVRKSVRKLLDRPRQAAAMRRVMSPLPQEHSAHPLTSELIVSLTSYPARYGTLHLTLRSLLLQSIRPDRLILWLAKDDISKLPRGVLDLQAAGLDIRATRDLKSFKKLVPALELFPDATIVTADDDLYYSPDWLQDLVSERHQDGQAEILCHRAHRLRLASNGTIRPYREREDDVSDAAARSPSHDLLFTTGAGVLFPPNSLDTIVTDQDRFLRICPHGDDLWFTWCAGLAGTPVRKIGGKFDIISWPGTDDDSLWEQNERGGNDRMIDALQEEFGPGLPRPR